MKYSVNILTLLALVLAIGMVVDDTIVVLENIHRRIEDGEPPLLAAVRGSEQVLFAVIATTLVLIAVFMPITLWAGRQTLLPPQRGEQHSRYLQTKARQRFVPRGRDDAGARFAQKSADHSTLQRFLGRAEQPPCARTPAHDLRRRPQKVRLIVICINVPEGAAFSRLLFSVGSRRDRRESKKPSRSFALARARIF